MKEAISRSQHPALYNSALLNGKQNYNSFPVHTHFGTNKN